MSTSRAPSCAAYVKQALMCVLCMTPDLSAHPMKNTWNEHARKAEFTQDEDFLALHAAGHQHAGISYAPQGTSIGKIVRGLMLLYQVLDADDMKNHVEFL